MSSLCHVWAVTCWHIPWGFKVHGLGWVGQPLQCSVAGVGSSSCWQRCAIIQCQLRLCATEHQQVTGRTELQPIQDHPKRRGTLRLSSRPCASSDTPTVLLQYSTRTTESRGMECARAPGEPPDNRGLWTKPVRAHGASQTDCLCYKSLY
jgi:hypothetical protein